MEPSRSTGDISYGVDTILLIANEEKALAARRQNNDASPGHLASTLRTQPVLLDQEVLQSPDMGILRGQLDRFSKGHDAVYRLLGFK